MSKPNVESLESLPKWAQVRMQVYIQDASYWKEKALAAASVDALETNVAMVDHMDLRGLPPDSCIRFTLPNGAEIEVHHSGGQEPRGLLAIYARNDGIRVLPGSSNVVFIECLEPTNIRTERGIKKVESKRAGGEP